MSDQEPIGKQMLGRLRDHTGPYQPNAWEHFEQFRARKRRKRRVIIYWLSAAASFIITLGTMLVVERTPEHGVWVEGSPAQERIKSSGPSDTDKNEGTGRSSTGNKGEISGHPNSTISEKAGAAQHQQLALRKRHQPLLVVQKRGQPSGPPLADSADHSEYLTNPVLTNQEQVPADAALARLQPRPVRFQIVHFSRLYIPRERQPEMTRHPARPIRLGIGLLQQSNQAAGTVPELNYGLGGAVLIPFTQKINLSTGLYAGRQSLHIKTQAREIDLTTAGAPQLQHARYHWVNVEVPVHLQYRLKTLSAMDITAAGGISLQGSAGQTSDYLYKTRRTITTLSETAGGPVIVSTETVEDLTSVTEGDQKGKWAIGTSLYLGLGINYPLKTYALQLEPFFKFPIGTVTAEKLQLTSFGMQLRLTGLLNRKNH